MTFGRLVILILHPPLRLAVDEAASAPVALGAAFPAEVRGPRVVGAFALAHRAANAEEDGGDQVAGHGRPGEGVGFDTDAGSLIVAAEGVACLDCPCTARLLVRNSKVLAGGVRTS